MFCVQLKMKALIRSFSLLTMPEPLTLKSRSQETRMKSRLKSAVNISQFSLYHCLVNRRRQINVCANFTAYNSSC